MVLAVSIPMLHFYGKLDTLLSQTVTCDFLSAYAKYFFQVELYESLAVLVHDH